LSNKEITGIYRFHDNELLFNENWIVNSHWTKVVITVFHEVRHAYQGFCIRNKSKESGEVVDKWGYKMKNYIKPSSKNNVIGDEAYLKQEI